jgi:hypothetical protein
MANDRQMTSLSSTSTNVEGHHDGLGSGGVAGLDGSIDLGTESATATPARGVATLTPEQLARKRANDRKAQRAIRERTRNQIDTLNARIRILESQRPHQEVQRALRQKDIAQAENEEIRRRLADVLGTLQDIVGAHGLNGRFCWIRCNDETCLSSWQRVLITWRYFRARSGGRPTLFGCITSRIVPCDRAK